jgi:type II secretory pathway component PulJ
LLDKLLRLELSDGVTEWAPAPTWAQFFLRLGWFLGSVEGRVRVSGIVIAPTATYVIPLVALGGLFARFINDPWSSSDNEEHANLLDELEESVPVSLRSVATVYTGVYRGKREDGRYRIQVEKAPYNRTFCIERSRALDIQPRPGGSLRLPATQSGRRVSSNSLIRELLGAAGYAMLLGARTEIALVGAKSRLESEFTRLSARLQEESQTLQQLVRVKEFGGTASHFAAEWLSASASIPPHATPSLVIYSSATDYLRASQTWSERNSIIATDVSDERIEAAIATLEEDSRMTDSRTTAIGAGQEPTGIRMWLYEHDR